VKGCRYVGTVVRERTQMKSNDTGTERKTGKHQDMGKGERKKHWTPTDCVIID